MQTLNNKTPQRSTGIDIARAFAILGMVIVNYKMVMNAETGNILFIYFAGALEGRAAALFVILAGIGITSYKKNHPKALLSHRRKTLIKRGLLLILIGLIHCLIWEADILHLYGFYFLIAATIFTVNDKTLLILSISISFIFVILMLFFNYAEHWHWPTLEYENFWSLEAMVWRIFFNGFHPVFPWVAFLVLGMWLGRQDLGNKILKRKLFIFSLLTFIVIEAIFYHLGAILIDFSGLTLNPEEIGWLLTTSAMPPLPQYMISASCSAVAFLMVCLHFSERFPLSCINRYLQQTGRLSLTFYIAHIIIGMGILECMGRLNNQTIEFALLSALIFFMASMVFSVVWLKYFTAGPLEWLFRKLTR